MRTLKIVGTWHLLVRVFDTLPRSSTFHSDNRTVQKMLKAEMMMLMLFLS
jgi:hypothetical protein